MNFGSRPRTRLRNHGGSLHPRDRLAVPHRYRAALNFRR
jgi:hypothetical protein